MSEAGPALWSGTVSALRRLARPVPVERCDLCKAVIPGVHRHLLELESRKVWCSCDACALRFLGVVEGRFKVIPRDAQVLPGLRLEEGLWESLALPINLAFFEKGADERVRAFYPSPAGVTESLLSLEAWEELARENPELAMMEAEVEALLVNRVGERRDYFMAPVDMCFELAGLIRMHWRGLAGGEKVWREIDRFFAKVKANARNPVEGERPCPL